jgi:DNA polymerase (family 10)
MTNAQVAEVFDLVADILEFQGANPFRVRAYRNAARTVRDLSEPVAAIAADSERKLTEIEGIGDDLAEKIATLVETGKLPMLEKLQSEVPESVLALMRIEGVGPKKAAALHKELGIATLDELRKACQAGKVRELKGFGEKTEQAILRGIDAARSIEVRITWADADAIAQPLCDYLRQCQAVNRVELAGSYRRGRETIGDLDVLVVSPKAEEVMDHLGNYDDVQQTIARGGTKMSVKLQGGLQVDLRVVEAKSFGAALQYFTGSKDHNVIMRGMAKDRGLKINEYGVFRVDGKKEEYVAGAEEKDVYDTLDLPLFPPEIREARREFQWAEEGRLPKLVELDDIRGDLHMHTNETDGKATLKEMVEAARQRGLSYIAITDHSRRVTMARGLDPKRLRAQWRAIDRLREELDDGFTVLKGIECDILEKGGMDLPDDVLAEADWVLASVHYGQKQPRAQITERIVQAIENPHVSAIAHPTGRLINRRPAYEVDLEAVFAAAKKHGKLLELNANPLRLDLNDVHCAAAKSHGIPIVISTDAHGTEQLGMMRYGVLQARRGGLTKRDVANTRTWAEIKKLLHNR